MDGRMAGWWRQYLDATLMPKPANHRENFELTLPEESGKHPCRLSGNEFYGISHSRTGHITRIRSDGRSIRPFGKKNRLGRFRIV
jgi:hypothetical protein